MSSSDSATVKVYSLPSCVQCESTKRVLKSIDVEFEEIDMSQDPIALEMVRSLGYTSAPVVISGEDHWSGFRMDRIKALKVS